MPTCSIEHGKIKAVGEHLSADPGSSGPPLVIDGTGLHVTPGIIDCHSHSMILGDVNEATCPSSAMVRIGDVVNSETPTFTSNLPAASPSVNLLHGSANPIGGQNCVIKLRDGESPEGLKFAEAPPGIKFALGENVKQSNWGEKYRHPLSPNAHGRADVHRQSFHRRAAISQGMGRLPKVNGGVPPRRDLELEAIGEIMQGKRLDPLPRLSPGRNVDADAPDGKFRRARSARSSTCWKVTRWLMKSRSTARAFRPSPTGGPINLRSTTPFPTTAASCATAACNVSFNSDSDDLARRLYLEAAKAVKYGGTPEVEALKFVTLNPAKQLRIDQRVGSLEPGKDADFAIWSKSPLDSSTVCQQTWIEGKKYFDVTLTPARTAAWPRNTPICWPRPKSLPTCPSPMAATAITVRMTTPFSTAPSNTFTTAAYAIAWMNRRMTDENYQ